MSPYELFMLGLSMWALSCLAAQSTFALSSDTQEVLAQADIAICVFFFGDFLYSLYSSRDRWRYLRTWGWVDLLSSVPAVDAFRIGRSARVLRVLRVLRGVKSGRAIIAYVIARRAQSAFLATTLLCIALVTLSSIAVLQFEVPAHGNIQNAQDAIWWSLSTMSTLGYGDVFPTTPEGRFIAIMLMTAGVGVFATMAGLISKWFLTEAHEESTELAEIRLMLEDLRVRLDARVAGAPVPDLPQARPGERVH